jgi:hypothetical protein
MADACVCVHMADACVCVHMADACVSVHMADACVCVCAAALGGAHRLAPLLLPTGQRLWHLVRLLPQNEVSPSVDSIFIEYVCQNESF